MSKTKIIFAGTPEFAVPFLKALTEDSDFEIIGVITQPDKPSGRKQEFVPSPIKQLALKLGLKIWQPGSVKNNPELEKELKQVSPDLLVVVAFGQIIPQEILDLAKFGNINVHPSLLPKYRGASPVQSAILTGETKTGVTIMLMDQKMDHGPILSQKTLLLNSEETNQSLHQALAELGVPLLLTTIKGFLGGKIKPQEQNHESATFCQTITKDSAKIDWSNAAIEIKRKIYAFYPWPGVWAIWGGKRIKFFPPAEIVNDSKKPGEIFLSGDGLAVGCGQGSLKISKLQLEGKKEMTAQEFLRGYNKVVGEILK
ncbi:MAG: methionyl-tRNA formyltransferase [Patescibacteria group bacterium]